MKKRVLPFFLLFLLLIPHGICEELPEGFYDSEIVKNAIDQQIQQFRQFTPQQVEVIYLASKILHEEYFGVESPETKSFVEMKIPQGEYIVGDLIPPGTYLVTLSNDDLAVIWVKKPGQIGSDYYSLVYSKGETQAYIILEEGGTFRVQHSTVILSVPEGL